MPLVRQSHPLRFTLVFSAGAPFVLEAMEGIGIVRRGQLSLYAEVPPMDARASGARGAAARRATWLSTLGPAAVLGVASLSPELRRDWCGVRAKRFLTSASALGLTSALSGSSGHDIAILTEGMNCDYQTPGRLSRVPISLYSLQLTVDTNAFDQPRPSIRGGCS